MSSQNGLPPRGGNTGSKQPASTKKVKKKSSPFKKFMKFVAFLLIIGIIAGGGYAYYLYNQVIDAGVDKEVPKAQLAETKPMTMLLLGTDYRPDLQGYRSDVNMVISMNPNTKSATVVSLPRDLRIDLDGYKVRKLNAYYPTFKVEEKSSGISAEDEMKKMISKYMDVPIDYVSVVNFQGFRDVVDAVGGVDVTVDKNMCYRDTADGTDINLKAGPQHLDGKNALDFVRYRKSNCKPKTDESNDFERNQRQGQVLNALVGKMQSLQGIASAGKMISAVDDNMTTDVEKAQIKSIISTYWNISKENILFQPVTGEWRSPYVRVNEDELNKAKQALQDELAGKSVSGTTDTSS
ncbi:LCP family protein [Paenibacillus sp. JX-17]|uniref:LCP family protein n=1 Tax=Paenibacillus lacisoli TaxID=3064525 RepID=A0ABT9CCW9_9BACL|nr:LCP family protein [Paenibacillus sp. JX-17]MDO7905428.1 LCP family protein [Paenibacillus sp. JX-17]